MRRRNVGSTYHLSLRVTSVLACHFLLNLRKVEEGRRNSDFELTAWETVQFTPGAARALPPFIASMGELIDFNFAGPGSLTSGSEDLEMTSTASHASDSANLPKVENTTEPNGEGSRVEPSHTTGDFAQKTSFV